ncbi:MAG: amidohydrolase family protein [Phycisphaerae bacterium]|nr:amidohydrolase family protein [Phycisphaerae bacterium]
MKQVSFAVVAVWIASMASAQDLGFKAPPRQAAPVAIENITIHTISGGTVESGFVTFAEGKITGVGSGPAPRLSGGSVVDGSGKHLYPGMIGANTQTGLMEIGAARATIDYAEVGGITPEVRAAVAVNPDSTIIPVTRSSGVLTVGVLPLGGPIPGRASVINLEGWTWEEMSVADDAGMVVNWPNMRPMRGGFVARSPEEQDKERREALAAIDQAFQAAAAYVAAKAADPGTATDIRWEAMRGVLDRSRPVLVRADELEQIQSAVAWAAERNLRLVIVGGRDSFQCVDLLKRHDVGVIVAGTLRLPRKSDSDFDEPYTLPSKLEAAGVRWCLASTGGPQETPHERNLPYHAGMAVAYGLDPAAAIRSITLAPAMMLGVGDRLGSIEVGKDATLIITDGDPLEITTKVERAFITGREIDLSNKQRILDKKYREKYRQLGITP